MLLTIGFVQILGAWDLHASYNLPSLFERLWAGGAVVSLPGFVAGLIVQYNVRPSVLAEKRMTVLLIGAIATLLTLVGLAYINGIIGAS